MGTASKDVSLIQALISHCFFYSGWVSPVLWCRIHGGILENILCVGDVAKPAVVFQEPSSPLLPSLWRHPRVKGDFVVTEHHEQGRWEENHSLWRWCEVSEHVPGTCDVLLVLHSLEQHPPGAMVALEFVPMRISTLRLYKQLLTPGSECLGEQLSDWFSACCLWTRSFGNMGTPRFWTLACSPWA